MVRTPTQTIEIEETDELVSIIFNRPDQRNAVNFELVDGLREILEQLEFEQKGILLAGNGPVTCAGADLNIITGEDQDESKALRQGFQDVHSRLERHPGPTVMAAKGGVIGGGCTLATICDFMVIGEETDFYKPEVKLGVGSRYSPTLLRHQVGPQIAREIELTGKPIPPERVKDLGLAIDVVPEEEVDEVARQLAVELSSYDHEAYATRKEGFVFDRSPEDFEG